MVRPVPAEMPAAAVEETQQPATITDADVLLALMSELTTQLRSDREAEHTLAAASLAAFAAAAWGVAALSGQTYATPAAVSAAVGIVLVSVAVIYKIYRSHKLYVALRAELAKVVRMLADASKQDIAAFPPGLRSGSTGKGYRQSIAIIVAAAIPTFVYCIIVALGGISS